MEKSKSLRRTKTSGFTDRTLCKCERCSENIEVGDRYAKINDRNYCENCLDDLDLESFLDLFDIEIEEVEEDDIDDGSDFAYECWRDERLFGID